MAENNEIKNEKIVVGMSGGVDSSMSLVLLKKQGWDPIGVSLKYAVWKDKRNPLKENVCCSNESFEIAKMICRKLKVPYHVFDVSSDFKKQVINYFVLGLKSGRTPNPCVICNRYLKFQKLFEWADKHKIKYVATGHYAKVRQNKKTKKYELLKAKDAKKDQTYSLSYLPQKRLKRLIFPLANYAKEEIFNLAKKEGFDFYLKRKQSQDFCFVSGQCLNCFLAKEIGVNPGRIKDTKGNILGEHQGLHFYTIGQRKNLGLPQGPYFAINKIPKINTLIVSSNEHDLLTTEATLSSCHFISGEKSKKPITIQVKIRSRHNAVKAVLRPINGQKFQLVFSQPQKAVTPGQFAVFYRGDICLGNGEIAD